MISTILLVFAFVFFCISAFWATAVGRFNLISAGLACWVLSVLLGGLHLLR